MKIFEARFYHLKDLILSSSTFANQDNALKLYDEFIEKTAELPKTFLAMIWLERSRVCYKHSMIKASLEKAKELLGLKLSLTGKMGRRTKFQQFDVPQLVLDVESESVQFVAPEVSPIDEIMQTDEHDEAKPKEAEETIEADDDSKEPKIAHSNVNLEDESILLEKIKLKDEEEKFNSLSVQDQMFLNAFACDQHKNYVDEYDLKYETVSAYIQKAMEKSNNWLIFSMSLLLRSRNEKDKLKTRERCMIQMQTLIDQYRDETPSISERTTFSFVNPYPLTWNLKRELGLLYQNYGSVLSAFELFKELDFYEDAAQ